VDLNSLISPESNWLLVRSRGISDSGWVAGYGNYDPDGAGPQPAYQRSFLLDISPTMSWVAAAGGAWETGSNWSSNFTPGSAADAVFDLHSAGAYTVTISTSASINNLAVRTDKPILNIASGRSLSIAGSLRVGDVGDGQLTITGAGALNLNDLQLQNNSRMTLAAGTARNLKMATLSISGTAKLDLTDNKLIVTAASTGSWNGSTYTGIAGLIRSGRNGGAWTGAGIVTSQPSATSGSFTSIGIATAAQAKGIAATATATWAGQTVTGTDTLVMYTYGGDTNLDGKINVDDYGHIDSSIPIGVAGWFNGDFNYDGKINVDDYGIIDFNIGIQGAPFPTAAGGGASLGLSAVPEPGLVGLLVSALSYGASTRRSRRHL
jgi:hypothetical protein